MPLPKYTLKEISVGSGSIIGRDNIEEFFGHVSKLKDFEDRSLVELAPNYEIAAASLVHMLEARFVNFNPIMQHMFLRLHDMEEGEKKDFVLETLLKEFGDVASEARKVFMRYRMLGYYIDIANILEKLEKERSKYTKETSYEGENKIPIPFKIAGMHEALEKNFNWIVPENLFDEDSLPKSNERGVSETYIDKVQCIVEKTSKLSVDAFSLDNT